MLSACQQGLLEKLVFVSNNSIFYRSQIITLFDNRSQPSLNRNDIPDE